MNKDIRSIVRSAYDIQDVRIRTALRIVGNYKVKMGQDPTKKENELTSIDRSLLIRLRKDYKTLTEGFLSLPNSKNFRATGLMTSYSEFTLITSYINLLNDEEEHFRRLKEILEEEPLYTDFLKKIKGVGPAMSGVIISEIDIHKAEYPASIWKYAGYDVAEDGKGRSRRTEHLIDREYTDKKGEVKTKKSITFNPFLKTKLYVLATILIKNGHRSPYYGIYLDYKTRIQHHPVHKNKKKGHLHAMAMRYMIKRFLVDLYKFWRELEGLPVAQEYSEAKLGMVHKMKI